MKADENINVNMKRMENLSAGIVSDESEEELQDRWESMQHPVIISYAILPAPPEDRSALLSPEGNPVYVDYSKIDWKSLAVSFRKRLDEMGIPKGIKVYIGNDAMDLFDVSRTDPKTTIVYDDFQPVFKAYECIETMKFEDFRGGIMQMPANAPYHLSEPGKNGMRTPVCGLFVAVRFDKYMQMFDYLTEITEDLIGVPDTLELQPGVYREVAVPESLREWWSREVNVVLGEEMEVFRMPLVRKRPASS